MRNRACAADACLADNHTVSHVSVGLFGTFYEIRPLNFDTGIYFHIIIQFGGVIIFTQGQLTTPAPVQPEETFFRDSQSAEIIPVIFFIGRQDFARK